MTIKKCGTCLVVKHLDCFYLRSSGSLARRKHCIDCVEKQLKMKRDEKAKLKPKSLIDKDKEAKCTRCKQVKTLINFARNKSKKQGINDRCKNCCIEIEAIKRKNKGIKPNIKFGSTDTQKQCGKCLEYKNFDCYYLNKNNTLRKYCKSCYILIGQTTKASDPEYKEKNKQRSLKRKEKNKNNLVYIVKHRNAQSKRRAQKMKTKTGDVTPAFLIELYNTEVCYYCKHFIIVQNRTMEHKVPLSRGGAHIAENLVMACRECNNSKHNKLPEEWEEHKQKLKDK